MVLDLLKPAFLHGLVDEAPRVGSRRGILPRMIGDQYIGLLLEFNDFASVVLGRVSQSILSGIGVAGVGTMGQRTSTMRTNSFRMGTRIAIQSFKPSNKDPPFPPATPSYTTPPAISAGGGDPNPNPRVGILVGRVSRGRIAMPRFQCLWNSKQGKSNRKHPKSTSWGLL